MKRSSPAQRSVHTGAQKANSSQFWASKGDPCIRAAAGRLIVSGCEFMPGGKRALILERGLKAATIFGCTFRGPQPIEDQSGADVQIGLNTNH